MDGSVKQRASMGQSRRSTAIAYLITCSLIWTRSSSWRIRASRLVVTAFLVAPTTADKVTTMSSSAMAGHPGWM